MAWKTDFENFLKSLPDDPLEGLFRIDSWFAERREKTPAGTERNEIVLAHVTFIGEWAARNKLVIPGASFNLSGNSDQKTNKSRQLSTLIRTMEQNIVDDYIKEDMKNLVGAKIKKTKNKGLTSQDKKKIRTHLNKIREIIEKAKIATRKANAIFNKINGLEKEIDRFGTNLDVIMGGVLEISMRTGEAVKEAEPVFREAKEILRIIFRSRAKEIGVDLPAPEEKKLIEISSPESD